jgi:peptidoglycan/LPS O-acetylase OafA/YrhL
MTHAKPDRGFRPEIQALRAIAVGSVLLYHLWPGRLHGGFVGVDVFFVISGYLITGHLLRDLEASGRIRLGRFWVRRARRLLPASLLVLALTAIATMVFASLSQQPDFLRHVLASTFYVENWQLARDSVDYLAADNAATPVQHYWSLGVEEQFYVAVPLILVALSLVTRRTPARRHVLVPVVLLVLSVASLALSIHQTTTSPGIAYFSTGTRAWEFLLGGLLASAGSRIPEHRGVQATLGWLGLAAIAAAVFTFDAHTVFPGYAAALPVLGAAAVIAAGQHGGVGLLARLRPVTFAGDISYALYLWHWPLIVLVPIATGEHLGFLGRVVLLGVTVLLAWVSTRWVEEPLRSLPRNLDGVRPLALVGVTVAAATALVAGLCVAGTAYARGEVDRQQAQAEKLLASGDLSCLGANVVDSTRSCPDFGDTLVPAPAAAEHDDGNEAECWASVDDSEPRICALVRPKHPTLRVLAVGDSHNNALIPAYRALATKRNWSLDVTGRAGCPWTTGTQANNSRDFRESCRTWKQKVAEHLADHPAYDVILTTARQAGSMVQPTGDETPQEATVTAFHDAWTSQIKRGTAVIAIHDVPQARENVVDCVEREGIKAAQLCRTKPARAFAGFNALGAAVAETPGSAMVDLTDIFCDKRGCTPVLGNVVVYLDGQHVTETFARTLAPALGKRIDAALERIRSDAHHP